MISNNLLYTLSSVASIIILKKNKKLTKKQKRIAMVILIGSLGAGIVTNRHFVVSSTKFIFYKLQNLLIKQKETIPSVDDLYSHSRLKRIGMVVGIIFLGLTAVLVINNLDQVPNNGLSSKQELIKLMKDLKKVEDERFDEIQKTLAEAQLCMARFEKKYGALKKVKPYSLSGY